MRVPPEESSSSTLVINEASSYCKNKHQRKEPTTITDLSRRKDISVIVGSTENNSLVELVEETTRVELFCKSTGHVRVAPTSQRCWQQSWRRIWMVQRLWMALDGLC